MTAILYLVLRISLAVVLYIFIWSIIRTLKDESSQQANLVSSGKRQPIQIIVQEDGKPPVTHLFTQNKISIGRKSGCTISLKDDALSSIHANIAYHHAQWWIEDVNSKNGTYLNKIKILSPTVITSKDVIKCGNTLFKIDVNEFPTYGGDHG